MPQASMEAASRLRMRWGLPVRIVLLLLLLAMSCFARDAGAQQGTHTPQTYTPQTFSPPGYTPQGSTPQTNSGEAQTRPASRRRLFHCVSDEDAGKYCAFYSYRDLKSGNPCTCDGSQGSIY